MPGTGNIRPIDDAEFTRFQQLIHRETGIHLAPHKRALLTGRLSRRLRTLGIGTFGQYYERVQSDPDEMVQMVNAIATNETRFFREPHQFNFLRDTLLPRWRAQADAGTRPRRVRAWSAACSTGQECYTLAMVLLGALPAGTGWEIEVFGTDISTRVLAQARGGLWPIEQAAEIPARYRKAFMLRGRRSQQGTMSAGPEIRSLVRFQQLNLHANAYPTGPWDLIFCRNVLIYFDAGSRTRVVQRLFSLLAPAGHLFLGHAEGLNGTAHGAQTVIPTVYTPASAAPGAPRRPLSVPAAFAGS